MVSESYRAVLVDFGESQRLTAGIHNDGIFGQPGVSMRDEKSAFAQTVDGHKPHTLYLEGLFFLNSVLIGWLYYSKKWTFVLHFIIQYLFTQLYYLTSK